MMRQNEWIDLMKKFLNIYNKTFLRYNFLKVTGKIKTFNPFTLSAIQPDNKKVIKCLQAMTSETYF